MSEKIPFRPVVGTEEQISNSTLFEGMVAFATDTKKIYYNDGEQNIPMGGNSGIYYANKIWEETPEAGQVEFYFTIDDIENQETPNINDLILNIPDGSFYRVIELEYDTTPIRIKTNRLTIAGGGGGENTFGQVTINKIGKGASGKVTTLYQAACELGVKINAYDSEKLPIGGSGTYKVTVGGLVVLAGNVVTNDDLYFDVGPYLNIGSNTVRIELVINTDLGYTTTLSTRWEVTVTEVKLTWNYSDTIINKLEESLEVDYSVTGVGIEKTLHLIVNGIDLAEEILNSFTGETAKTPFVIDNLKAYGFSHGAYKAEMYVTAIIDGEPFKGQSLIHNLIFIEENNDNTIISCNFYKDEITQYDTVEIPIVAYSSKNSLNDLSLDLIEDGVKVGDIKNVTNATTYYWAYTPTSSGLKTLVIQSGTAQTSITTTVIPLDIDIEEVPQFVYNFKANNFANSDGIKNWSDSNGNKLISFSDNFDWINGGLKQESVDGSIRPYLCIKAGSQVTMNYELFGNVRKGSGKSIKVIFKAVNCRDYDAQVLSCKKDIKVISTNTDEEILLVLDDGITLNYASAIEINADGVGSLFNPQSAVFDRNDEISREIFKDKFIEYENKFYKCNFNLVEDTTDKYYSYFYEAKVVDSFRGLYLTAQQGFYKTISSEMETQYCENSYIEFELNIGKQDSTSAKKNYLKFWMDGVPANFVVYDELDSFTLDAVDGKTPYITIGSEDCDVYLYLLKIYDKGLSDEQHLQNFIADGYNANEIVKRFKRNDILDERNIISPTKLALANPDCAVHVYTIDRIPKTKKDKIPNCSYRQYKNSDEAYLTADGVTIKVQGTSSEKYVISAANLDSSFDNGFNLNGEHIDKWSMSDNAIGVDFFCTKVNVASCENANNALNQMWYNAFQPYKSVLKCKNPKARDTMEFINGVLFIQDNNTKINQEDAKDNNIFCEIDGYVNLPSNQKYPRLYSLANMGNSKDNIEVFHDITNPKECCIEVNDNQTPQQWMTSDDFLAGDIDGGNEYYGFRYPDGAENASPEMIQGWIDFVNWMATSNPQPLYEVHKATNEKEFKSFAYNQKTAKDVDVFIAEYDDNEKYPRPIRYVQVYEFNPEINEYFTKTNNKYGYTNLPLGAEVKKNYEDFEFKGYKALDQKKENGELWQKDYEPLVKGIKVTQYNYKNYLTYDDNKTIIPNGIADNNGYTHDTYEYRMAKMLDECEEHLVMDSILYHYLFIERHCMIDNVAKNTFWSTEDGKVWNLIKDYDNDTADGNDNNGKFTRTYGMEPMDRLNSNTYVFNARQSVWLNFVHGLEEAKTEMYQRLEEKEVEINGTKMKLWNKDHYLKLFKDWQDMIPERAWIEAYHRLYARPYEVYKEKMYIPMMEGGKKTHQRTQYETYQDIYMSSEYKGVSALGQAIGIRGDGKGLLGNKLLIKTYSDCYIIGHVGGAMTSRRTKRNEESWVECPVDDINNVTYYIYPGSAVITLGDPEGRDGFGTVGDYSPAQIQISGAPKIRELVLGLYGKGVNNNSLKSDISLEALPLLEKVYACNFTSYTEGLNLQGCPSLKELDARNSSFTSITIADGAPVTEIKLQNPTALKMTNLNNLEEFIINDYNRLLIVDLQNIDQSPGVNSKNILSSMKDTPKSSLIQYRLTDIDWTLDDNIEVDEINNTIPLIEYLLDNNTLETSDGRLDKKQSLTGNIYITSNGYNDDNAIDIYNEYVNNEKYSNLDIIFEDDNSKLYKIYVYDGNGNIYWQKRIQSNGYINNTAFFENGPNGQLDISKMLKSETATAIYKFLNKWEVVINDVSLGEANWNESGFIDYSNAVTDDIHLYPIYEELEKLYTLNFYNESGSELLSKVTNAKYGDLLLNYSPDTIPYKTDSNLTLEETYSFKGYSLFANNDVALPANYSITSWEQEQNFYAVFQKVSVYDSSNIYENYFDITSTGVIKPNKILSGKVTIPSSVNNIQVTEIDGDAFRNNSKITHIFLQPGNSIKAIGKVQGASSSGSSGNYGSFANCSNLVYFDFNNFNGEIIGNGAFFSCNLINESPLNLSNKTNLTTLGSNCFNSGFKDYSNKYELNLPNSITYMGTFAIANNNINDFTITIGTPTTQLNSDIITSDIIIRDNSNRYLDIYYYCKNTSDLLNDENKIRYATCFGYKHNDSNALRTLVINGIDIVREGILQVAEGG